MRKLILLVFTCAVFTTAFTQKKPLDHTVYDSWQSIGERMISNDGKWVVYSINPQEGDNELFIQSSDATYKKPIPRGYNAVITEDSRYVLFKIRPLYKDTRDARIKKKRPDDMPKDTLAIVELGKDSIWKTPRVKTYKTPEKESGWVAYHLEKPIERTSSERPARSNGTDKKIADSLNRVIDSLYAVIESMPAKKKKKNKDNDEFEDEILTPNSELPPPSPGYGGQRTTDSNEDAEGDDTPAAPIDNGTDLVVRNLESGKEKTFNNVLEYYFSKKDQKLLVEQAKNPKDSLSKPTVLLYDLKEGKSIILSKGGNDFKNFVFSDDGSQVAYIAERDAKPKELQKFYKLWYYKTGMDSAVLLADKNKPGMHLGMTISEYGNISFSKTGQRLFFGTTPIQAPKDTSLIEIDQARLDIWHYNDDYLQTVQLFRLQRDLQTNYLAVYHLGNKTLKQLASVEIPTVYQTNDGDGDRFYGVTDFGKRIEGQWTGNTKKDIYAIDVITGEQKLVKKDLLGVITPQYISSTGKYVMWYDSKARNYFTWDGDSTRNITARIKLPLWNEEHDSPSDPPPYGVMGWQEGDSAVYVYDKYDFWNLDPSGKRMPKTVSNGRKDKLISRYIQTDPDDRTIKSSRKLFVRVLNDINKNASLETYDLLDNKKQAYVLNEAVNIGVPLKAANSSNIIYTKESYVQSSNLFTASWGSSPVADQVVLSATNQQQKNYNWGTSELYKWKTFKGKESEGILYKPEDFDPNRKYPVIIYFYEELTDGLNSYIPPAPTASRVNISFFVSRGYIVFAPDIKYTIGHPAKSAYDYVVSGAQALTKYKWIDGKNMGIQGQSWGGIQVAQLVTMTNMFKAAWAGAPVANMTSAYGGIRWESGVTRQFQYEKTQSRIGATLWEKPELYIENSPLFHLPKVKTPLVIMSNDADGAVPWYQGIELFTAMRRLNKKAWLLVYNGEAHNLVERRNRKDIQIREQQYFDWLLKGDKPAKWITEGVPAVKKGKDWGLEIVD
jgi:dienelactone hydrolase